MNFAYRSSCIFTDSSTRAWIVANFGCFGGALMIAMLCFSSSYRLVLRSALRLAFSDSCKRPKHGHASCVTGGSDPTIFWAAEAPKSGVAPARFGGFSTLTFVRIALLCPTLQRNCSRHRLKNLRKTELKHVVLTFFTPSL
jgi:hypothetical protein